MIIAMTTLKAIFAVISASNKVANDLPQPVATAFSTGNF